jgi:branched-chain amino acid transport system substrate-binding protein
VHEHLAFGVAQWCAVVASFESGRIAPAHGRRLAGRVLETVRGTCIYLGDEGGVTMCHRSRVTCLIALVAAGLLAVFALAACGSSDDSGSNSGAVSAVKIGTLFPMTGDLAKTGAEAVDGAKLALEEINAAGGIKSLGGAKLELDIANTQGKPEVGMSEAERVIQQDNVAAVIGTSMSSLALPISQKTERLKTPFIVCDAVSNEITERGYKYTFRLIPKSDQYAEFLVNTLVDLPTLNPDFSTIKRVATIHEDSDYGTGEAADITSWLEKKGLKHTTDVSYPYNATDLTTQVNKVKASKPDAVAVCSYLTDAIVIAQARERLAMMGIPFIDAGGGAQDPNFAKTLGDAANSWLYTTAFLPSATKEGKALGAKFETKFGTPMNENGMWGYQSIYVIAKALENAKSADRNALRDAIASVKLSRAAGDRVVVPTDTIQFDAQGQDAQAALYAVQWQGGVPKAVYPKDRATDTPVPPK